LPPPSTAALAEMTVAAPSAEPEAALPAPSPAPAALSARRSDGARPKAVGAPTRDGKKSGGAEKDGYLKEL
jgi:hypothetical protein